MIAIHELTISSSLKVLNADVHFTGQVVHGPSIIGVDSSAANVFSEIASVLPEPPKVSVS
jgi:hypothetical protein